MILTIYTSGPVELFKRRRFATGIHVPDSKGVLICHIYSIVRAQLAKASAECGHVNDTEVSEWAQKNRPPSLQC